MRAPDRCVWAPGWSANHSRRYDLTRRPSAGVHGQASAGLAYRRHQAAARRSGGYSGFSVLRPQEPTCALVHYPGST
jgi:hypothetical protein